MNLYFNSSDIVTVVTLNVIKVKLLQNMNININYTKYDIHFTKTKK